MGKKDPSRVQEPRTSTERDIEYRIDLETYFESSIGSNVEKLQNFAKYVPRQTLTRFISKYEIFKKILNIQGSIVECGVFLGGGLMTFAQLSAILEPVNHQRKIIGFDTFSGVTDLSKEDEKGESVHAKKGGFAIDARAYEDLKRCIELYDSNRFISHIPKVFLVKGDVKETLPKYLEDNPHTVVSLLYLDMDVFQPTRVAIERLVPRMPKGAIIAFDELNANNWPGETLAVLETIGIKNLCIERFTFESFISFAVIE
ncbi:TylF/MycF/NovP-related O-methyltransferase [Chloroflexota bacterium]